MDTPSRKSIEEKQLQHSGDLGLEQPGTLYGSTPLPEAFNKHLTDTSGNVIVPEDPSSLSPVETEAPKKRHNRLLISLGAGAAGLAVAAGAIFGINAANQAPEEGQRPVATAPGEPTAEPAPENTEQPETDKPTVAELEIPAGLDSETLGKTIIDRWSDWMNSGASDELRMDRFDANESWDMFLPKVAEENKELFTEALYVDAWQDNPNLVENIENTTIANTNILTLYSVTAWNGDEQPENKEGFRSWMTVDQVSEQSSDGTTRTILVAYSNNTNSDLNKGPAPTKAQGVWSITTQAIDGFEKIIDVKLIQ